jgi:ABC-type Fe3+/spermidine/putrescine transport system ATPase subunit
VHRGARLVVREVSFTAERGELLALMGASGSGKTTVLRAVAGLDPISGGEITVDGVTASIRCRVLAERCLTARPAFVASAMVFQYHHLFAAHDGARQRDAAPRPGAASAAELRAESRAHALLASLGVAHRADSRPHELSGGEASAWRSPVALAGPAAALLMDEPNALPRSLRAALTLPRR